MAINGIEMVTDRSISDVEIAKSLIKKGLSNMTDSERQQFLNGLKGAYNYTDFNRVESAIEYLAQRLLMTPKEILQRLQSSGVAFDSFFDVPYNQKNYEYMQTKTNWQVSDLLLEEDRKRYISNILSVISSLNISMSDVPKKLENINHIGANRIEQSLEDLNSEMIAFQDEKEYLITQTAKAWLYSGDLYGSEI
jgi:hypothetical protein